METIIGKNLDFTLTGDSFEDLKYKSERSCYELSDIRIAEDDIQRWFEEIKQIDNE